MSCWLRFNRTEAIENEAERVIATAQICTLLLDGCQHFKVTQTNRLLLLTGDTGLDHVDAIQCCARNL